LSFSFGVFVASFIEIPVLALYILTATAVAFISILWSNKKVVLAGFLIIFIMLGVYRYQMASQKVNIENAYDDLSKNTNFQAVIVQEPDVRIKDTQYVVKTLIDDEVKILVTMPHYPAYKYGDLIEIDGKIKIPEKFDAFDYQGYLAKDGVYFIMYNPKTRFISSGEGSFVYSVIFSLKNVFKERLKLLLPEPEISLLNGLLLGERSGMSEELKNDFSVTGTSHIVAVSGFNVTIIAVIILEFCLLLGFSRSQAFWVSLLAIISFIIMVGAPASAIRAGIMGGLVMVAMRVGRLSTVLTAIVFAATLMVLANPKIIRFDVGFQLSFLAVVGLVWVYPMLEKYFQKIPDPYKIKSMLLVTISAQIMALPILIYNFDRLSIVAPLANILILPFIPFAMGLGFLAGVISYVWIVPAKIFGYFTWIILTYQIRTIEYLASLSWASLEIYNFGIELFILYYIIVIAIIIWDQGRRKSIEILKYA
jgi:competence protein ComEC